MTAAAVWAAVEARYDEAGLVTLTNIRDRSATAVDDAVGTQAAGDVLDLWPAYTQVTFDANNGLHLETAVRGTIALLWERGGTSSEISEIEWAEVFGPEGMMSRVRATGPRGHLPPGSNSGVRQKAETANGQAVRGWSDAESLPQGRAFLPSRVLASGGD